MINEASLLEFLEDDLGIDVADIERGTPLFSSGLVDSFALVNLMMHLETVGGFRINAGDVTLDNFDTIDRILDFVKRVAA